MYSHVSADVFDKAQIFILELWTFGIWDGKYFQILADVNMDR